MPPADYSHGRDAFPPPSPAVDSLDAGDTVLRSLPRRLWDPVQRVAEASGRAFLLGLAGIFTELLQMDLFLIGSLTDEGDRVRTFFFGANGVQEKDRVYPLATSPCGEVIASRKARFCPRGLNRRYSLDGIRGMEDLEGYCGTPLLDEEGRPIGILAAFSRRPLRRSATCGAVLRFFSARVAAELQRGRLENRLAKQNRFSQGILDAIPTPIFFKGTDGLYQGCNDAFARFIGLPKERIVGQTVYGVAPRNLADVYQEADRELLHSGEAQCYQAAVVASDGRHHEVRFQKAVFTDPSGRPEALVGTMIDITERREAEKAAQYLTHFDPLTNLPNQVLFLDRLNMEIATSHRMNKSFALVSLDLDHFKKINIAFGHQRGDEILQRLAKRLTAFLCENDTVSRMGGDSFNLLLPDVGQQSQASKIAMRLLEALRQPFHIESEETFLHASMGIAIYPHDGGDARTLLKNADTALNQAKERGRNHFQFFASEMNAWARERMVTEGQLRTALKREEFVLHFQPQIDSQTLRLTGVEALLRWRHPTRGLLLPSHFIDLAEETGIILPLGEWVLRSACRQAGAWRKKGLPPVRIGVNLSPRQFQQSDLFETIAGILDETGTDPTCLNLEITENVVMEDIDRAIQTLTRLKGLGIRISIDDFGTGYSSLGYLRNLPIDMLKIDRSFVMEIPSVPDDMAIVSAVISMAHSLNIKVLAEGVQSLEQKEFLQAHRCDELQGYYFSRPLEWRRLQRLMQLEITPWNDAING